MRSYINNFETKRGGIHCDGFRAESLDLIKIA